MPLTVSDLHGAPVPVTLHLDEGDVEVTWYPGRLTGQIMTDIAAIDHVTALGDEEGLRVIQSAAGILCTLLASWDVRENPGLDGEPGPGVALTQERLSLFGIPILWGLVMALLKEARMGEPNGTASKAPSRATTSTGTRAGSRR